MPALRFPEFSGEWEVKTGNQVTLKITKGSSPNWQGFAYQSKGTLFITSENVRDGFLDISAPKFLPPEFHSRQKNSRLKHGDILINIVGASIGRCCLFMEKRDASTNQAVALFRVSPEHSQFFISYCYQQNRIQSIIRGTQSDSARSNLSLTDLNQLIFTLPLLAEQQKIADFLGAVDERLDGLHKKRDLLRDYKRGAMQKIFNQQIRFTRDDGTAFPDWEEKRINKVARKTASVVTAHSIEDDQGEFPVYGASGYIKGISTYASELEYISIVKDGAGVGRLLLCAPKSSVLGTLDSIIAIDQNDTKFLYYRLSMINFVPFITGSTIPHIYFRDYGKLRVEFPHADEQKKIADFLSAIDEKIEAVESQITATEAFKKGLLQQMFV